MENNQMIPVAQKFQILEKEVDVPENLNIFNEYRLTYRELAKKVTTELVEEYKANIKNLDDFLGKFPELYKNKLEILTKKAVDTLVSEGVWTITYDSFLETHINDFHLAMDDYKVMVDNFNAKIEENQRKKEKMWGYVPTLMGGGFGISGVLKGIATATAYNLIRDGIEENSLKKANVKPEQRIEIYKLLNTSILFDRVFADYWNVFLSLVWHLNQNGKKIWWATNEDAAKANSIFENISNPNFPQDKILDVLLQVILMFPYNEAYYNFFIEKFGENEQIDAIKKYFGFTGPGCNNRISE